MWFPTSASSNAAEVKRVDANGDGVISAAKGDADTSSDGFEDNSRLFIPATPGMFVSACVGFDVSIRGERLASFRVYLCRA